MKVLTVVTKNGTVKEFPLPKDNVKIATCFEVLGDPDSLEDVNFVCVNPTEIAFLAVLEYPEASPSEETTNFEIDSGPTL